MLIRMYQHVKFWLPETYLRVLLLADEEFRLLGIARTSSRLLSGYDKQIKSEALIRQPFCPCCDLVSAIIAPSRTQCPHSRLPPSYCPPRASSHLPWTNTIRHTTARSREVVCLYLAPSSPTLQSWQANINRATEKTMMASAMTCAKEREWHPRWRTQDP